MALLIYSTKCKHSMEILGFINETPQLRQIVKLHDVNQYGIPQQYTGKINRVPTLLTQNGKMLVGNEVKQWLTSLLPAQEIMTCDVSGRCKGLTSSLDGEEGDDFFELGNYGQSLQPAMTPELQAKISRSVADAYDTIKD
jgi:hypothetical protein